MRIRTLFLFATAVFFLGIGLTGPLFAQEDGPKATLKVDLKEDKAPISPGLYGIFMEEINHGFDGGIYAELIQNRSFEEGLVPAGMKVVKNKEGKLKLQIAQFPEGVPESKWETPWPWGDNSYWFPERELIGWSLKNEGGAKGEMKLTEANPMNKASARSLEMKVETADAADSVKLINGGYWVNQYQGRDAL